MFYKYRGKAYKYLWKHKYLRFIYSSNSFLIIVYDENRDLTGAHLYEVYSKYRGEENAKEFCKLCRECLQTHETIERLIEYNSPIDNSGKHATIAIYPATNERVELQNIVIVLKDVTEFYEMKEKAEIAGKAKTEFLANMSHEIRTPMNAIVGMVELIMREDISDTVRENIYNIKSAGTNLLGIINDILDISKVESGKIESQTIEDNEVKLKVSVKDTGMGIKEDLEKLFESFKQVDTRKNRNIEGTGLGIAISKSLVELMGEKIFVESVYG